MKVFNQDLRKLLDNTKKNILKEKQEKQCFRYEKRPEPINEEFYLPRREVTNVTTDVVGENTRKKASTKMFREKHGRKRVFQKSLFITCLLE